MGCKNLTVCDWSPYWRVSLMNFLRAIIITCTWQSQDLNSRWNSKSRGFPWFHAALFGHVLLQPPTQCPGLLAPQTHRASSCLRVLPQPRTFVLRMLQNLLPPILQFSALIFPYPRETFWPFHWKQMALPCCHSLYTEHVYFLPVALIATAYIVQLCLLICYLSPSMKIWLHRAGNVSVSYFCIPHV